MTPQKPSDPERVRLDWAGATDQGQGPVLLALHGLPGTVRDFRWLGTVIEPQIRLVRLELPGFGNTPQSVGARWEEVADFVAHFIETYIDEPVALLGHSFGSTDAVNVAFRHPDKVNGVALIAPFPLTPHLGYRNTPNFNVMRRAMRTPFVKNVLNPRIEAAFQKAGFKTATAMDARRAFDRLAHFRFDRHRQHLKRLTQSTLVGWADDDPLIETDLVAEMADVAPVGPRLRYTTGGHNIQKTQAIELGGALVDWVRRL